MVKQQTLIGDHDRMWGRNVERYDTVRSRFWAGVIDTLVFVPVSVADLMLATPDHGTYLMAVWGILSYSSYWLYSVLLHARFGQTVGKMIMKVKVLDLSEERILTLRQAVVRDIGYIVLNTATLTYLLALLLSGHYVPGAEGRGIPGLVLSFGGLAWFFLEVMSMMTNGKRRAIHDLIAGTVVVQTNRPS